MRKVILFCLVLTFISSAAFAQESTQPQTFESLFQERHGYPPYKDPRAGFSLKNVNVIWDAEEDGYLVKMTAYELIAMALYETTMQYIPADHRDYFSNVTIHLHNSTQEDISVFAEFEFSPSYQLTSSDFGRMRHDMAMESYMLLLLKIAGSINAQSLRTMFFEVSSWKDGEKWYLANPDMQDHYGYSLFTYPATMALGKAAFESLAFRAQAMNKVCQRVAEYLDRGYWVGWQDERLPSGSRITYFTIEGDPDTVDFSDKYEVIEYNWRLYRDTAWMEIFLSQLLQFDRYLIINMGLSGRFKDPVGTITQADYEMYQRMYAN